MRIVGLFDPASNGDLYVLVLLVKKDILCSVPYDGSTAGMKLMSMEPVLPKTLID